MSADGEHVGGGSTVDDLEARLDRGEEAIGDEYFDFLPGGLYFDATSDESTPFWLKSRLDHLDELQRKVLRDLMLTGGFDLAQVRSLNETRLAYIQIAETLDAANPEDQGAIKLVNSKLCEVRTALQAQTQKGYVLSRSARNIPSFEFSPIHD